MSEACDKVHRLVRKLQKHSMSFNEAALPKNGIYVLFESGESGHDGDRIVRIGTHTGDDQLRSRLRQHFRSENKDRSIFRKNIGRALLNQRNDPFLQNWEIDLTTRAARNRHGTLLNSEYLKQVEKEVTQYLQDHFTFVAFEVKSKSKRLDFESKLISTVSACKECGQSRTWLGNYSPKQKIVESGLWLVNELYKTKFTISEVASYFTSVDIEGQIRQQKHYRKREFDRLKRELSLPLTERARRLAASVLKMNRIELQFYIDFLEFEVEVGLSLSALRKKIARELRKQIENGQLIID